MIYWKPYQLLPVYFLDHRPSRRIAQCAGATECRQVAASGVLRDEMRADRGDCVTRHLVITRYFFINNSVLGRCLSRVLLCFTGRITAWAPGPRRVEASQCGPPSCSPGPGGRGDCGLGPRPCYCLVPLPEIRKMIQIQSLYESSAYCVWKSDLLDKLSI